MQVAGYVRVSSRSQARVQTIDQQIDRLRTHAAAQGWDLAQEWIFRDDGPCCTDQRGGHIDPNSRRGSCDANRLRASELEHAVQSTNGDRDFSGLTTVGA